MAEQKKTGPEVNAIGLDARGLKILGAAQAVIEPVRRGLTGDEANGVKRLPKGSLVVQADGSKLPADELYKPE